MKRGESGRARLTLACAPGDEPWAMGASGLMCAGQSHAPPESVQKLILVPWFDAETVVRSAPSALILEPGVSVHSTLKTMISLFVVKSVDS